MSARSSKQHKVADSDRENTGAPHKDKRIAKAPSISRRKEPKLRTRNSFLRRALQPRPTLHLNRINNRSGCLSKCKKVSGLCKLAPPGLIQPHQAEHWGLCGGRLKRGFFPPLSACFKHVEPSRIVGDIPPLEETADCLTHLARSAAVWEVLLTGTCRPATGESRCFGALRCHGR